MIHLSTVTAANSNIEDDLHASASEISWSLSLFIMVQGSFPILWSAVSEIKGRKACDNTTMLRYSY